MGVALGELKYANPPLERIAATINRLHLIDPEGIRNRHLLVCGFYSDQQGGYSWWRANNFGAVTYDPNTPIITCQPQQLHDMILDELEHDRELVDVIPLDRNAYEEIFSVKGIGKKVLELLNFAMRVDLLAPFRLDQVESMS